MDPQTLNQPKPVQMSRKIIQLFLGIIVGILQLLGMLYLFLPSIYFMRQPGQEYNSLGDHVLRNFGNFGIVVYIFLSLLPILIEGYIFRKKYPSFFISGAVIGTVLVPLIAIVAIIFVVLGNTIF